MPLSLSVLSQSGPPKSVGRWSGQVGSGRIPHFNWSILYRGGQHDIEKTKSDFYTTLFVIGLHMGIFDELYPGVKKFKVQDGNFLKCCALQEKPLGHHNTSPECLKTKSFSGKWDQKLP